MGAKAALRPTVTLELPGANSKQESVLIENPNTLGRRQGHEHGSLVDKDLQVHRLQWVKWWLNKIVQHQSQVSAISLDTGISRRMPFRDGCHINHKCGKRKALLKKLLQEHQQIHQRVLKIRNYFNLTPTLKCVPLIHVCTVPLSSNQTP